MTRGAGCAGMAVLLLLAVVASAAGAGEQRTWVGSGRQRGFAFTLRVPLRRLGLPDDIEVLSVGSDGTVEGFAFLFTNSDVRMSVIPRSSWLSERTAFSYRELEIGVPNCRVKGSLTSAPPFLYPVHVWADELIAVTGGRVYGYDMTLGRVSTTEHSVGVFRTFTARKRKPFGGETGAVAAFSAPAASKSASFQAQVKRVKAIFAQPWIGRRPVGEWQCAAMAFNWALARVEKARAVVSFKPVLDLVDGMRSYDAVFVDVTWRLEAPFVIASTIRNYYKRYIFFH